MPKHKPIKFKAISDNSIKNQVSEIIKENPKAKSVLNATLGLVAMGGVLTLSTVAPSILIGLGGIAKAYYGQKRKQEKEEYQKMWHAFDKLKKQRAIELVQENDDGVFYRITEKGEKKIRRFVFDELTIKTPKKWDKKWRLVIFDIPETKRKERAAIRKKLKDMEFYQCQKSAWIYPFPCEKEIEFVKDILNIKPFVKLFIVDKIDDGKTIYHFKDIIKKHL